MFRTVDLLGLLLILLPRCIYASYSYISNVTWPEANERCTLATPNITDFDKLYSDLSGISEEYRNKELWVGYNRPDILIGYMGCVPAENYTADHVTYVKLTNGDISYCFSVCKVTGVIGIQRKNTTLSCYCLTDDMTSNVPYNDSCTDLYVQAWKESYYIGIDKHLALYRRVGDDTTNDTTGRRCVAYGIESQTYVYKDCRKDLGVICHKREDNMTEVLSDNYSWRRGAKACLKQSHSLIVIPNEAPSMAYDRLAERGMYFIWTRLKGKYSIIVERSGPSVPQYVYTADLQWGFNLEPVPHDDRLTALCYNTEESESTTLVPDPSTVETLINNTKPMALPDASTWNTYVYVGVSVGAVVVVLVIVLIILLRRRNTRQTANKTDALAGIPIDEIDKNNAMADNSAEDTDDEHFYHETEFHNKESIANDIAPAENDGGHFYHETEIHLRDDGTNKDKTNYVYDSAYQMADKIHQGNAVAKHTNNKIGDLANAPGNSVYDVSGQTNKVQPVHDNVYHTSSDFSRKEDSNNATGDSVYDISGQANKVKPVHDNVYHTASDFSRREDSDNATPDSVYDVSGQTNKVQPVLDNVYHTSSDFSKKEDSDNATADSVYDVSGQINKVQPVLDNVYHTASDFSKKEDGNNDVADSVYEISS